MRRGGNGRSSPLYRNNLSRFHPKSQQKSGKNTGVFSKSSASFSKSSSSFWQHFSISYQLDALAWCSSPTWSQKIQDKVHKVGFDWPEIGGIYDKLAEELAEVQAAQTPEERADELGDLLFAAVTLLASWLGVDAESALRGANLKFSQRFRQVEALVAERNLEWEQLDLAALEEILQEVKGGTAVYQPQISGDKPTPRDGQPREP
jgi:hypothetical protein